MLSPTMNMVILNTVRMRVQLMVCMADELTILRSRIAHEVDEVSAVRSRQHVIYITFILGGKLKLKYA